MERGSKRGINGNGKILKSLKFRTQENKSNAKSGVRIKERKRSNCTISSPYK